MRSSLSRFLIHAVVLGSAASPLSAQYLGYNLRGDFGLKSGSQAAPGVYLTLPLFYQAEDKTLRGAQGNVVGKLNAVVNILAPSVAVTTKWKLLGGHYGFNVTPMFLDQRLNVADPSVSLRSGIGWGDMYIQPANLGWTTERADFIAGYGLFVPAGTQGRTLNMWGHEMFGGTTVYLDPGKRWHVAGTAFYEIHQKKQTEDIRVGDFLTIEGGAGRAFRHGLANVGAAYVMQWKTTEDTGSGIPIPLRGFAKNQAFAVGPEFNYALFVKGTKLGVFGFRYTFEKGNKVNFQGNNLLMSFTLARLH
jgi:hypothetical protein